VLVLPAVAARDGVYHRSGGRPAGDLEDRQSALFAARRLGAVAVAPPAGLPRLDRDAAAAVPGGLRAASGHAGADGAGLADQRRHGSRAVLVAAAPAAGGDPVGGAGGGRRGGLRLRLAAGGAGPAGAVVPGDGVPRG